MARNLGASEAGYYFWSFSIITVLATFSRIGTDSSVIRFTGEAISEKNYSKIKSVFFKSAFLSSSVGLFVTVVIFFK